MQVHARCCNKNEQVLQFSLFFRGICHLVRFHAYLGGTRWVEKERSLFDAHRTEHKMFQSLRYWNGFSAGDEVEEGRSVSVDPLETDLASGGHEIAGRLRFQDQTSFALTHSS